MNIFVFIFILANSIPLFGQKENRFPFQVVDAENAYRKNGGLVKRFDLLSSREMIKLESGSMLLVHYTGIPVTVKRDTVVNLRKLSAKISKPTRRIGTRRPDIKQLFSFTPIVPQLIHDYKPPFIFPPPRTRLSHNVDDDLCLKWVKGNVDSYIIEVRNMFDDSLKFYYSETNSLTIPAEDLGEFLRAQRILLISVSLDSRQGAQIDCAIFRDHDIRGLFQCEVTTPDKALMIGYYYELAGNRVEAESYYRLSKSLSEEKVFSEVIDYFERRYK